MPVQAGYLQTDAEYSLRHICNFLCFGLWPFSMFVHVLPLFHPLCCSLVFDIDVKRCHGVFGCVCVLGFRNAKGSKDSPTLDESTT